MKILENLGKTWSRNLFEMNFKKIVRKYFNGLLHNFQK